MRSALTQLERGKGGEGEFGVRRHHADFNDLTMVGAARRHQDDKSFAAPASHNVLQLDQEQTLLVNKHSTFGAAGRPAG